MANEKNLEFRDTREMKKKKNKCMMECKKYSSKKFFGIVL